MLNPELNYEIVFSLCINVWISRLSSGVIGGRGIMQHIELLFSRCFISVEIKSAEAASVDTTM